MATSGSPILGCPTHGAQLLSPAMFFLAFPVSSMGLPCTQYTFGCFAKLI